jgi:Bifunctional DNA primase/polymerase, N-terminal
MITSTPELGHIQTSGMLDAALDLAQGGWHVFPCEHEGPTAKAPMTPNGHLDASTDTDQIRFWWTERPKALIGARVPDTLAVIDIDPRNGGSLDALEKLAGRLPDTLTAWSGRNDGGRHLYFLRPNGPLTSTRLPKGIDLKARGYCIMPPSLHPATGRPYVWELAPVADMSPKLRDLLRPVPRPVRRLTGSRKSGTGLVRKVAEAEEGSRHNVLVWACYRAQEDGILDDIAEKLIDASVRSGEDETAARRTVDSVSRSAA